MAAVKSQLVILWQTNKMRPRQFDHFFSPKGRAPDGRHIPQEAAYLAFAPRERYHFSEAVHLASAIPLQTRGSVPTPAGEGLSTAPPDYHYVSDRTQNFQSNTTDVHYDYGVGTLYQQ